MHLAYISLLVVLFLAAEYRVLVDRRLDFPPVVGAGVVFANWTVNTAFVIASGDTDPELVFLATDIAAVIFVARYGQGLATVPGQMLLASYAGQIIMHVIHWFGQGDPLEYWRILTLLGYGQLLLLAGWALARQESGHGLG